MCGMVGGAMWGGGVYVASTLVARRIMPCDVVWVNVVDWCLRMV